MDLLVIGGTHHVGRAVAEAAVAAGHDVTTVNRGTSGRDVPDVEVLHADRTEAGSLAAALDGREWDAVIDTWSKHGRVVAGSAGLLAGRVGHYGYVSSCSVYRWPLPTGADEATPTVDGDADSDDYSEAKRAGEQAVTAAFPDDSVLARAGLILGPYELVGRMPWWLRRLERGGRVLAPGPRDRGIQYVDCRDLADWMVRAADEHLTGPYNAVSPPGATTIGEILAVANDVVDCGADLAWATPEAIEAAGIAGWTELPVWLPPTGEEAALYTLDVGRITTAGLRIRPIAETVADTWTWLRAEGDPATVTEGRVGLDPEKEAAALASLP